ncbi:SLIT and NTRK-like protein 6 [Megalops cyprinoides]|uniref:SLIT and NTRK-like protein 6 n=1 Tax=Megalops cyprinoides TaxID=118141 RepID=UPI0018647348|nr:SLIT and NTRK-like protein 6 [Megalops cyprinoides]
MLACIIFITSFIVSAGSQNLSPFKASLNGSCGTLCTCKEKDNILYLSCEERNITKITQIQLPSALPFHLSLYKNELVELRAEDLEYFKNAISLHLGANSIQELQPGVFSALGSLKKLHINSNFLVTLKEDTFQGLINLEYLQADTNFIRLIEPGAFNKLVRLKVLILNDNSIEFLPGNIFRFMPLTHLDLRGNQLQSLPYMGFLEHLGRIMEFLLEDNNWVCDCDILPLKIWIENLQGQSTVDDVVCSSPPHLKGSLLSKVKQGVLCPSHSDLDLGDPSLLVTEVEQVPKMMDAKDDAKISSPEHKTVMFCSDRCSCHNHPTAGFLVHCQDRGIRKISDLGLFQQSPTKLVLTGNMIQRLLHYDFVDFESLKLLNLANNQIDHIDNEAFLNLGHLKKLHLNANRLDKLSPGMFTGLHNVEYMYLEYNVIKAILPGTFNTTPNLKLLYLNNNLLQTLPSQIFNNVPLARLNLRKNMFMHLPVSSMLDHLNSLEQIYLEDNPWDCSCDLVALKQWVEKHGKNAVVGTILCHTPSKIAKMELRTLRLEAMCSGLVTFHSMSTNKNGQSTATTALPTSDTEGFFHFLTDTIPLSVLILSLLIIFLAIIFCAAGMAVFVLHRRRGSKKKQADDQAREGSPLHLQYNATALQVAQRPKSDTCNEPTQSPVIQMCRNPACCAHCKEHELEELNLTETKHVCRSILEKENISPLSGLNLKFRAVTEYPSDFVTLGDTGALYRNILEREKELQQLGITEYLRKNISQLPPSVEIQSQGRHEEMRLMEAILYTRPRRVMVEETKNEYFELKANSHTDHDYLEVLEHPSNMN